MEKLAFALCGLLLAASPAAADEPLTLDRLFSLPVQDAAALALGPGPEVFVERSPYNAIAQNYVANTVGLFGMSFFTRPERIAPGVCMVMVGRAELDARGKDWEEGRVRAGQLPQRLMNAWRERRYFAAGPAPATPLLPGGPPATPSADALKPDSCENPVSHRTLFSAPSPDIAISSVSQFQAAISAAQQKGLLPFEFKDPCGWGDCQGDERKSLAGMATKDITDVGAAPCAARPELQCLLIRVPSWNVWLGIGPDGKIKAVWLSEAPPPPPI